MTTKVLQHKKTKTTTLEDAWETVRGMWRGRKPDAMTYQRKARADRRRS